jgi:hypothetical protein
MGWRPLTGEVVLPSTNERDSSRRRRRGRVPVAGTMCWIDLHWAQRTSWAFDRALIRGVQPYIVGGPLSHCAINKRVRADGSVDVFRETVLPTDKTLTPI